MKKYETITINGTKVYIYEKELLTESLQDQFALLPKGNKMVSRNQLGLDNVYTIAGYDTSKIDWAVPQPWLDHDLDAKVRSKIDKPSWIYSTEHPYGAPIWYSDVLKIALDNIQEAIA